MLKRQVRALLVEANFAGVAEVVRERRRALGSLVALTFDRDPEIGWRAVEAMGVASAAIADEDPDAVRELLRRLVWLLSEESGGVCWRAPEAMAEIVHRRPDLFADFVPIVVHLLQETAEEDLVHFRAGILWAIGRLGAVAVPHVEALVRAIVVALEHPDPQVRGMAVWALGQIGCRDVLAERPKLVDDHARVEWYEGGALTERTVAVIARRALGAPVT